MHKKFKFIFLTLIIIFSVFLSGCRYNMFWNEEDEIIGESENYVISKDSNGEYYISGFTNKGLAAKTLRVIKYEYIDSIAYEISYVDDIFKNHTYVRTLLIDLPSDKLNIKGCKNLRVVQISQENLIDPDSFFEGLRNIDIYIIDSLDTYEDKEFLKKNNVYYEGYKEIGNFEALTFFEYTSLGIILISLVLCALALWIMFYHFKKEGFLGSSNVLAISCSSGLIVYFITTLVLLFIGKENLIYFKGLPFLLPISFLGLAWMMKEELETKYNKLFLVSFIISSATIILNLIIMESMQLIISELVALLIVTLLIYLIYYFLDNVSGFANVLIILSLLIACPIVYLCDMLLAFVFSNVIASIIFFVLVALLIAFIIWRIIKSKGKNNIVSDYVKPIKTVKDESPVPELNGVFFSKVELPDDFKWDFKPSAFVRGETLYIHGSIVTKKIYDSEYSYERDIEKCKKVVYKSLGEIFTQYFEEHPNSKIKYFDMTEVKIYSRKRTSYKNY